VNCGPRFNFLYIALPFYYYSLCLHYCILLSLYHLIRSILCSQQTGEIDNLIKVGSKVLGCVMCTFHVAAGEKLHADKQLIWRPCPECHEASKHHLLKFGFLLQVRSTLVSQLREICCCAQQTFLLEFSTGCLMRLIAPSCFLVRGE
jgi:hypothetical protein